MADVNLYLSNKYLDMGAIINAPYPFIIVISGRGGGKTYGSLKYCLDNHIKFLYLRRTKTILELITDPRYQPFKRINADTGRNIISEYGRGIGSFKDDDTGELVGYAAALSTISNIRGFDGSDIELIIWDEFIPEPTERATFNQLTAFYNAVETIGRNREFEGRAPLKSLLLSNSDLIYSDVIAGLGIGETLYQMQQTGTQIVEASPELLLIMPKLEAFRDSKADTALYRLTAGTSYASVALDNKFAITDRAQVKRLDLRTFKPVSAIDDLTIYKDKSGRRMYISRHRSGSPKLYETTDADLKRFRREQQAVIRANAGRRLYFEDIDVQTKFFTLLKA